MEVRSEQTTVQLYLSYPLIRHQIMNKTTQNFKENKNETVQSLVLLALLYNSENGTIKTGAARRITAAEMKYMRRTAGYTWMDYKTNTEIAKELNITPVLDKIREYERYWLKYIKRIVKKKKLQNKRQKKPGETIKETSRRVRPERVNRCPAAC